MVLLLEISSGMSVLVFTRLASVSKSRTLGPRLRLRKQLHLHLHPMHQPRVLAMWGRGQAHGQDPFISVS